MNWLRASIVLGTLSCSAACAPFDVIEAASDGATLSSGEESSETRGSESGSASATSGDGDGDPTAGDGDPTGDGDGDPPTGDGDGDTDTATGDGDGDGDPTGGPVCGDGMAEDPEECDGDDFGGRDCETFGMLNGFLTCDGCSIDTSNCEEDPCGNGVVDPGEDCDTNDFDGLICADFGEAPGSLTCDGECTIQTGSCGLDGEGDDCFINFNCGDGLYCTSFKCWDGSVGDDCENDNQCITGNCADIQFIVGTCEL